MQEHRPAAQTLLQFCEFTCYNFLHNSITSCSIFCMNTPVFLGIDVGTGSARAGLFTADGVMLGSASQAIRMWRPKEDFVEQSSDDIWKACCEATKAALKIANLRGTEVAGIGFDATCSLVALDAQDRPVSVSPSNKDNQNVIVWMDHRSAREANEITAQKHPVLRYVGGTISPEMQTPKLLWLKRNHPNCWKRTARFFDLPDFLTYRATGDDTRSLCSTVCKWTYLGHRGLDSAGWDIGYFRKIGLKDLVDEGFARIGHRVRPMGEAVGQGLTPQAAKDLGLLPGTPVSVSIIDAHAGGIGMLGAQLGKQKIGKQELSRRLALIGGTSSCHMAVSPEPRFVKGIWGPYFSAMVPDFWLTEGGQSATGALIDHIIFTHPASQGLKSEAKKQGCTIYELLNARLDTLAKERKLPYPAALTQDLHIQPDFHGNRSPRADASLKGMISGLPLSATVDDLAVMYLAAIQAVAYGTRHILEEMNKNGHSISQIFVCGGGSKNPVFLREHADITGCRLVMPQEPEAVLLGSAVLGATAAGTFHTVIDAMAAMNSAERTIEPTKGKVAAYHEAKYKVFHRMHTSFLAFRKIMRSVP